MRIIARVVEANAGLEEPRVDVIGVVRASPPVGCGDGRCEEHEGHDVDGDRDDAPMDLVVARAHLARQFQRHYAVSSATTTTTLTTGNDMR